MSGEKAVVTCQKYQFSENKKIGLFQPKAPRHLALAHVELKREHVVTPAGQPQGHNPSGITASNPQRCIPPSSSERQSTIRSEEPVVMLKRRIGSSRMSW